MHSSQNEQDSRWYAEFAQVPAFEPSNQQQAYDMTRAAFEYSEAVGLPVLIRLVTRLAHSRATVQVQGSATRAPEPRPPANADDWTLVPTIARRRFAHLLSLQPRLVRDAEGSAYNTLSLAGPQGVIACGIACNYLSEAIGGSTQLSLLKLRQYPLPVAQLRAMVDHCSEILVLEDGYPWLEKRLRGLFGLPGKSIKGRMSGDLPASGELTPDNVAQALGRPVNTPSAVPMTEARRPPQLCKGCPHIDTFKAMLDATAEFERPLLFSDIGCYTLGIMPPYRAVHSCVDMGASISMAHGAAQAGAHPVLCTIGDSTFAHSGMTGLLGAVHSNANMTVFILDNGLVAMTGAQESHATGDDLMSILRGLGVPAAHLRVIDPLAQKHKENVAVIKEEIAHEGLSVVVAVRPCIHMKRKQALA
jgi:indolepyruvate ferredoxin oxidoreductase alpha subunit